MFEKLTTILTAANPDYRIESDTEVMQQLGNNNYANGTKYVYVEEYVEGVYSKKYYRKKETQARLWFCRYALAASTPEERRQIRREMEEEIILPFIDAYEKQRLFGAIEDFRFDILPPRFDNNEVNIVLEFNVIENKC